MVDAGGNSNLEAESDSLNVMATTLSITSAPVGTSLNALLYPVSGNCDTGQGDVVVTVGAPNESSTVNCVNGSYNAFLNISGVTENPMSVTALQNGNNKSFLPNPINDQNGPVSAPIATAPGVVIGGTSYNLVINCNEAQEIVSITGNGIDPDPQTHICAGSGLENFELNIKQGVSFSSPNNLTISSTDEYENPSQSTTSVDVAIDTLAPTILISNGGDIIEGDDAVFTVTVNDESSFLGFTPTSSSGTISSGACSLSPCTVTVTGASVGELTLTVAVGTVVDAGGNSNLEAESDSLNVMATTLSITSAPVGTSLNALLYPVSGNCDTGQGDVVVTVGAPNESSTVNCVNGSYNAFLNISGVTENPMSVTALQNGNNKSFLPNPINDQNGPVSAPIATAPGVVIGGTSYNLVINCNEAQEIVSITGNGIDPDPQTHICAGSGLENFELNIEQGVSFSSPNNLTISSTDEYENPSQSTTSVDVAIDTLAPTILISNGGDIIEGDDAVFTVTVNDESSFLEFTPTSSSGTISSGACSLSPCTVTVTGASVGELTLTVAVGTVVDAGGNSNLEAESDSLNVMATTLSITSAPVGTSLNALLYPVSGNCDTGQGDVVVTVGAPNESSTVNCVNGSYNAFLNISGVTENPMSVTALQNGNNKSFLPNPINDQNGPVSAPIATAPGVVIGGTSYNLVINCNEAQEIVSITGNGIDPDPQTHICAGSGLENFELNIEQGVSFSSPNNLTISSTDEYENPSQSTTSVDVAIDTLAPTILISNGGDIIEGDDAVFTVTVNDESSFLGFTPTSSSGTISSGACSLSPCTVTVTGASVGELTLTVAVGTVVDAGGNSNLEAESDSLNVMATTLSITSAPVGTSLNALLYPVSGNCDTGQGDVVVTVGAPNESSTVNCVNGSYNAFLNISGVTENPMSVTALQNGNNKSFLPNPINDQNGPVSAPIATAPGVVIGGTSYNLVINCNEAQEIVSITGNGIDPDPQTHICAGSGLENFELNIEQGVSFSSPNNLTISSTDEYENPSQSTTSVDVAIDTLAPTILISNGGDIIEGDDAVFTVTVNDESSFLGFTPTSSSGTISSGACSLSPCTVTVTGASVGELTLTVAVGTVVDAGGNSNLEAESDSLNVMATTLSITSAPVGTSLNALLYPVSGNCDTGQGDVVVTVGAPNESSTVNCVNGSYNAFLNISGVTENPMSVTALQNGNNKSFLPNPINDQNGPVSAPIATAPGVVIGGTSYNLVINCNEAQEIVSITGNGIDPDPQTHICAGSGLENFELNIEQGVSFSSPNNLTISSTDEYENPSQSTTSVDVAIDTLAPTILISNGGDIIEGDDAVFTVTVNDESSFLGFTPTSSSGTISSGACSLSPCTVTVTGASVGELTLTVAVGAVVDAGGNSNLEAESDSLNVMATTLSITSAPVGTSLNALLYPVSGNCDTGQGDVVVTVGAPNESSTVNCVNGSYNAFLNISGVTENPMSVTALQNGNNKSFLPNPINDQNGPVSAPIATAPGVVIGGTSYNLVINCNEAQEIVSITGNGH